MRSAIEWRDYNGYLRTIRKLAKAWAYGYEPSDIIVPISDIRDLVVLHLMNEYPKVIDSQFRKNALHEWIAANIWRYVSRDVLTVMRDRGYVRTPNTSNWKNMHGGAGDLLLKKPDENSDRIHFEFATDLLIALRSRTENLENNAANRRLEVETMIAQIEEWAAVRGWKIRAAEGEGAMV